MTARTEEGLELVLRPRGIGRFLSAGFLTFWLCGWVAGEAFALGILVLGAAALLTGTPPARGGELLALGPALAMGAFLLFWLSIWTIGGYAAMRELLRLVWSQDRIVAGTAVLRVIHRLGPFRSSAEIPKDTLRRIYLAPRRKTLSADTDAGPIALSTLGSPMERAEAAAALRAELRVPEEHEAGTETSLPHGWEEIVSPEGEGVLVKDRAMRRKQARVALVLTLALASVASILLTRAVNDLTLIPAGTMACAAAAALGWGTARLARSRIEWRIRSGSLTRRRRTGEEARDVFEASRLELTRFSDGDGDDSYVLEALAPGAVEAAASWPRKGRCTIERAVGDPALPRRLGAWLSARAHIPLEDRTTQEALNRDRELAFARMRESGPLGRWIADWVERLGAKPR